MSNWVSERQLLRLITEMESGSPETEHNNGTVHEESFPCALLEVKDGLISVHESGKEGYYPTIEPVPPVKISVNGENIAGLTEVKPGDRIEWELEDIPLYRIDISPDHMKAWFVMDAAERHALRIVDQDKTDRLVVSAVEDRSKVTETIRFEDIVNHTKTFRCRFTIVRPSCGNFNSHLTSRY